MVARRQLTVRRELQGLEARTLDEVALLKQVTAPIDAEQRSIDKAGDRPGKMLARTLGRVEEILADEQLDAKSRLAAARIITDVHEQIRAQRAAAITEAGKRAVEAAADANRTMIEHRKLDLEARAAELNTAEVVSADELSDQELAQLEAHNGVENGVH